MKLIAAVGDIITLKRNCDENGTTYFLFNHSREENNIFEATKCDLYFLGKRVVTRGEIYLMENCFIPLRNLRVDTTNRSSLDSLIDYNMEKRWTCFYE